MVSEVGLQCSEFLVSSPPLFSVGNTLQEVGSSGVGVALSGPKLSYRM